MAEDEDILVLEDEEIGVIQFTILDRIELEGVRYLIAVPNDELPEEDEEDEEESEETVEEEAAEEVEDEDDEDDEDALEVVVLKVEVAEDGEDEYCSVEDDDLLDQIFEMFHDRHVGEFDFE